MCAQGYFKDEKELASELCKNYNLEKIEAGLRLVLWPELNLRKMGGRKIDMLCYKSNEKEHQKITHYIGIELKAKRANYRAFAQILIYLLDIRRRVGIEEGDVIRGMIIAHEIGEDLKQLVAEYRRSLPKVNLKEYRLTPEGIDFEDVTPETETDWGHWGPSKTKIRIYWENYHSKELVKSQATEDIKRGVLDYLSKTPGYILNPTKSLDKHCSAMVKLGYCPWTKSESCPCSQQLELGECKGKLIVRAIKKEGRKETENGTYRI